MCVCICACVCACQLTLSDNILNNLDGLVKLSGLDLHWVGPNLHLLGKTMSQRSEGDHKPQLNFSRTHRLHRMLRFFWIAKS